MKEALPETAKNKPVEIWFQDEARVGQQGTLTRMWAQKGTRPRAKRDLRYEWAYIFGAACPARAIAEALVLPRSNALAFQKHLSAISKRIEPEAHGVVIIDGAGFHVANADSLPANITLIRLPPYSPELNSVENIWAYLRSNKLANTVFGNYNEIVEACCNAWNFFANDKKAVTSISKREWATINL